MYCLYVFSDGPERLKAMDPLCELVSYCQFANDECDYGEALELGLNLLSFGPVSRASEPVNTALHGTIMQLLPIGYDLVKRPLYGQIVREHLLNRSCDVHKLSVLH